MSDRMFGERDEELPRHFSTQERRACRWLWDCNIRPWLVDLVTHEVTTVDGKWPNLVEYAIHHGMK